MNRIYGYFEFSDPHIVRDLFYETSIRDDYYEHTNWRIDH